MSHSLSFLVVHNFDTFEEYWSGILQSVPSFGFGCYFLVTTLRLYLFGKNVTEVLILSHCFAEEGPESEATACAEGLREPLHLLEPGWWVPESQALSLRALSTLFLPVSSLLRYHGGNGEVRSFLLCRQIALVFS